MKRYLALIIVMMIAITSCSNKGAENKKADNNKESSNITCDNKPKGEQKEDQKPIKTDNKILNKEGKTIETRFNVINGCKRIDVSENSFGKYIRDLELKPHGSEVKYYNGSTKSNNNVYEAVVDMDIGDKNLQQCADAVMRLRGEYLYSLKKYDEIHFNLTNGFRMDYKKWKQGYRVKVSGNKTSWVKSKKASNTYKDFREYMTFVFIYAGTLSLEKELEPVKFEDMQIGDVLVQGGSPGHAVIVVDMAEDKTNGKKYYMLAQSYMPAQDIQILCNPNNSDISPWYMLDNNETIITPEWTFSKDNLKRFK
ncbi:DUF4846 domain-containing protein [Clostridiaceae bacterium M8S5]|nr:DUF4846 domain-containing protein [Clostridiaceae bacterium M8S5]